MKITNLITSMATTISCLAISQLTAFAADEGGGKEEGAQRKVVIGFIAKSLANDVFQVAQAGAKDAARELGEKYNVTSKWRFAHQMRKMQRNRPRQ